MYHSKKGGGVSALATEVKHPRAETYLPERQMDKEFLV
jgi:hypothetical protein